MIRNNVPLEAIFVEGLVGLFMLFLAIRAVIRYTEKRSMITYYLTFAFSAFALAAMTSAVGKIVDFTSSIPQEERSASDFTILLAYVLLTIGNIYYTRILKSLYLEEGSQLPLMINIGNGLFIGLSLTKLSFDQNVYNEILSYLVLFIILTLIIHGNFFRNSLREANDQESIIAKRGFQLIGLFSITFVLVIVLFLLDLIVGTIRDRGYTIFYYLGWIFVGLSTLFGFLGFIMPNWFRRIISGL